MAGNRGLDIQPLDDGNIAYLIGKFITFESHEPEKVSVSVYCPHPDFSGGLGTE